MPSREIVKYLGVNLDAQLKYTIHVDVALEKAKKSFFSLKRLFYSTFIEPRVKVLCYVLLIRPILTYGCMLWFAIAPAFNGKASCVLESMFEGMPWRAQRPGF